MKRTTKKRITPKAKSRTRSVVSNERSKRTYLKQSDVPSASLSEALRIPEAIFEHYAGRPTSPLRVAKVLNVDPNGTQLKVLSGASIAFGLIEGGAQAASISVTDLSTKILRPKNETEDVEAKREAVLRPRVFGEFLRTYDRHPFPRPDISINVLEDMGVPREKTQEVLERIESSAQSVGFIEVIKGKNYVALSGADPSTDAGGDLDEPDHPKNDDSTERPSQQTPLVSQERDPTLIAAIADDLRRRRVFVTHGKNRSIVDPIKRLLEYGELEPVVSVERESVSKPVPEKFMDDMRGAGAAIIHVDAEQTVTDSNGKEHILLNSNVLIEIGAAMAFYGRRFILLVRSGVSLPSNLQGLYEVRYTGDTLDANATIKLLEAIKDIKNHALPAPA